MDMGARLYMISIFYRCAFATKIKNIHLMHKHGTCSVDEYCIQGSCVVWHKLVDVSEEPVTSIFKIFTFLHSPSVG
jgi:hypothetical protein